MPHLPRFTILLAALAVVLTPVLAAHGDRADPRIAALLSPGKVYTVAAGRSPLPQPGETFNKPIPARRLAPEVTGPAPKVPASGIVPWDRAHEFADRGPITVEGKIADTHQIRDIVCRLNFDRQWQGKFYVAVFNTAWDGNLPQPAADYYKGKTVRVSGLVTMHRNQPNLEVRDLAQIEIVE